MNNKQDISSICMQCQQLSKDSSTASLGSLNDQQINIMTDGSFSINITKGKYGVNNKTSSNSLYVQSKKLIFDSHVQII